MRLIPDCCAHDTRLPATRFDGYFNQVPVKHNVNPQQRLFQWAHQTASAAPVIAYDVTAARPLILPVIAAGLWISPVALQTD
jgi:hypothetical protein